ncbi:MAG: ABC transporter substrate-binding protein [Firmicutes bacterium]|nr:ABC transporter substrate-binding protein [Bacillota bacterium]
MLTKHNKVLYPTRAIAILCILMMTVLLFAGCGGAAGEDESDPSNAKESKAASEASEDVPKTSFTDDCGRQVEVPEQITSVIASGSMAQIVLYAIAPDTLIAINGAWTEDAESYTDGKYLDLPQVGSFFGNHDLNYEEIAKLSPQIVIDVGEDKPDMESDLQDITDKTGIPAVHISADYDSMDQAFQKLGELLNRPEEAKALADFSKETMDLADETMKKVKHKKTLMYCTQEDGLNVLAKDSYHSQIIDWLSDNVAEVDDPSSQGSGNEVNLEQMMIWDPEVIVFAPGSYYDYAADDPAWQTLSAIKKGNYYEVPSGPYNWMGSPPSSNRIIGILWMVKLLYPKQADFDLKEKTMEYYRLFYHCELTDDGYEALVRNSILK